MPTAAEGSHHPVLQLLDEKLRRLYAGLEALKSGRGGDARIAELLGLDSTTVARGRRELLNQGVEVEQVHKIRGRAPINGRKKTPEVIPDRGDHDAEKTRRATR